MEKEYRVVKIVDDKTIIINAGSNDGIKIGNKFEIFEVGKEIIDPISKENLGALDTIKDTVEVVNLYPKMCLCRHIIDSGGFSNLALAMARTFNNQENKLLNVEVKEISGGLSSDLTIRVGDKVRHIK